MLREIVVRDSDRGGSVGDINEAISAMCQKAMVNPNMRRSKDTNGITVAPSALPDMGGSAPNHAGLARLTIMNTYSMDNNMTYTLHSDAWSICNLYFSPSTVYGLKTIHNELILERDDHVLGKNDP